MTITKHWHVIDGINNCWKGTLPTLIYVSYYATDVNTGNVFRIVSLILAILINISITGLAINNVLLITN